MKKSKYSDLHEETAKKIVDEIFCPMCSEHEYGCRFRHQEESFLRCFTKFMLTKKIKKLFDRYD